MIKVALEDALTKLKEHFHGEKPITAGLFHHAQIQTQTQTQTKTINQNIHTKNIRLACCLSLYKTLTVQVFILLWDLGMPAGSLPF